MVFVPNLLKKRLFKNAFSVVLCEELHGGILKKWLTDYISKESKYEDFADDIVFIRFFIDENWIIDAFLEHQMIYPGIVLFGPAYNAKVNAMVAMQMEIDPIDLVYIGNGGYPTEEEYLDMGEDFRQISFNWIDPWDTWIGYQQPIYIPSRGFPGAMLFSISPFEEGLPYLALENPDNFDEFEELECAIGAAFHYMDLIFDIPWEEVTYDNYFSSWNLWSNKTTITHEYILQDKTGSIVGVRVKDYEYNPEIDDFEFNGNEDTYDVLLADYPDPYEKMTLFYTIQADFAYFSEILAWILLSKAVKLAVFIYLFDNAAYARTYVLARYFLLLLYCFLMQFLNDASKFFKK